jgi:hypothetical protein
MTTGDDITILSDAVRQVRNNPKMYLDGADEASGAILAHSISRQLIFSNVLPLTISRAGSWWIIIAGEDWLAARKGDPLASFTTLVPFRQFGPNDCCGEILLTAFAQAVVTADYNGPKWVSGDPNKTPMPHELMEQTSTILRGRLVAFRTE